jgi:pimeloyl-ACP methyl ester carboxylesterase
MVSRGASRSPVSTELRGVPEWFTRAVRTRPSPGTVIVEGCRIAYGAYGAPGPRTVILIHGIAAHARWWDHLAPLLVDRDAADLVLAVDLSGHGDSGRRTSYSASGWAAEIMAIADLQRGSDICLVGHSLGGRVAMAAALTHADRLRGIIAIDSTFRLASGSPNAARRIQRGLPRYATKAEAVYRFHLLPRQPSALNYVVQYLAAQSVEKIDDCWTWRFDPAVFGGASLSLTEVIPVACDVALVRPDEGLMTSELAANLTARLRGRCTTWTTPGGHHVLADRPLELVETIMKVLDVWRPAADRYASVSVKG